MRELGLAVLGLVVVLAVLAAMRFYFGTAPVISTPGMVRRLWRRLDSPKR